MIRRVAVSVWAMFCVAPGCARPKEVSARDSAGTGASQSAATRMARVNLKRLPTTIHVHKCITNDDIQAEECKAQLARCLPRRGMPMAALLHGVRAYEAAPGEVERRTEDDTILDVDDVLGVILDDRQFNRAFYSDVPYVTKTVFGARFSERSWSPSAQERASREAHVGQTLSVLAEFAVAPSAPVHCKSAESTVAGVIDDQIANFSLDQSKPRVARTRALSA